MVQSTMPAAVRQYVTVMRLLGVVYAVAGCVFFFSPKFVFWLLNMLPSITTSLAPLPESTEFFWVSLTFSMMAMLSALSFAAAAAPQQRSYAWIQVLAKVVSSLGLFYYFMHHHVDGKPVFGYLAGVITDLPIAILVLILTLRAAIAGRAPAADAPDTGADAPDTGADASPKSEE